MNGVEAQRSENLRPKIVAVADLTSEIRERMFELMVRHYDNVSRRAFNADLNEKQWVIQVWHPDQPVLCGFSTQMLVEANVGERRVRSLFSGDTIIDQQHWGQQALMHGWGSLAVRLMSEHSESDLYWFLLSQGYKTYRFLPLFFHEFYPRFDVPTPDVMQETLDALASSKYPTLYDSQSGVVRASSEQYRLREGIADVTPERLVNPNVRFFLERNAGHASGDELCCVAPLTLENFTRAGRRFLKESAG